MSNSQIITKNLDQQFKSFLKEGSREARRDLDIRDGKILQVPVKTSSRNSSFPEVGRELAIVRKPLFKTAVVNGYGADVGVTDPQIRNPLLNTINFYLPEQRQVLNQWIRYWDRFDTLVGNCIDLHAEIPFSRFSLTKVDDPYIKRFFEDMCDEIELFRINLEMSREYELIGEVFPFAHWNYDKNYFDDIILLNPDFLNVRGVQQAGNKNTYVLELVPDPEISALVHSNSVEDQLLVAQLDDDLVFAVKNNMNIQLDPFNVSPIMRKQSPYDTRGTAVMLRCLKTLLYKDKLREAQTAVAEGKITPYQIWKLGDGSSGYMPTTEDLHDFRSLLQAGKGDMDYNIISHYALNVEFIGLNGKLLPLVPEFEYCDKEIMMALFTNPAFVSGEGPSFGAASVGMRVYQARYDTKREKIVNHHRQRLFRPVSLANGFTKISQADLSHGTRTRQDQREIVIPDFKWEGKVNLVEDTQRVQFLIQLRQMGLPLKPIIETLGLDYDETLRQIDSEEKTSLAPSKVSKRMQPQPPGMGGMPPQMTHSVTPGGSTTQIKGLPTPGTRPAGPQSPEGQINKEQRNELSQFKKEQASFEGHSCDLCTHRDSSRCEKAEDVIKSHGFTSIANFLCTSEEENDCSFFSSVKKK